MLLSPAALGAAFIGFDTQFQKFFTDTPTRYDKIATTVPSNSDSESHAWLDAIDELREWIGPRQVVNLSARLQSLKNKLFERTFAVKRTDIEDDKLGVYGPAVSELARVAKLWPDKIVTDALKAGGTTTTYDGQYFFDTDHPVDPDSGTDVQANLFPGKTLDSDTYAEVRAAMMSLKGRNGVPLEIMPDLLIVPPSLEKTARNVVQASLIGNGVTNVYQGTSDVLVLPRLAGDATANKTWYLACTTRAIKPFIFQLRAAPEFASLVALDNPKVFELDEFQFGVRARGAAGYGLWHCCAKAVGA